MLSELKKGDDVVTQGGIIGKITGIKDNEMTLQMQEGVRVRVLRSAVTGIYTGGAARVAAKADARRSPRPRHPRLDPRETTVQRHGKSLVVEGSALRFRHRGGGALPDSDAGPGGEAAQLHQGALPEADPAGAGPSGRSAPRLRGERQQGGLRQGRSPRRPTSRTGCGGTRASPTSTSNREDAEGHYDIVLTFKNPTEQAKVDDALLREYRKSLDVVSRDPATGVVRLRLDPDQIDEVRDYALRQGIETIRNRVDKLGVSEPTIIKKGTDIIVELPGLKPADFERIKSIIGRTAQLEFKIVDDGSEYMKKVAAAVPKRDPKAALGPNDIDVGTEAWNEEDSGKPHEDVYLRSKSREALQKFFAGLTRRPGRSRPITRSATRRCRGAARAASRRPTSSGAPTTCTSGRR